MFDRILVPVDSSKLADAVLPYAEELAGNFNSEVTLMYVCEPGEQKHHLVHKFYMGKIAELVKSQIERNYPRKRSTGIKVKSEVVIGKQGAAISDYANNNDISLIVIAGRGRSGIMRRLMGQIADRVLRDTSMPVLLTKTTKPSPELGPMHLLDKILIPLDGSKNDEAALPCIKEFVKKMGTEVTLLRVITPRQHVHTMRGLDYVRLTDQEIEYEKAKARRYLEQVGRKLSGAKAILWREVRIGEDIAKEITHFANEMNIRLIVVTPRRKAGIGRWISGSETQKVLQATNVPVLLFRTSERKS
ncbi:universal stress protein [Chloroflexota bacterium]